MSKLGDKRNGWLSMERKKRKLRWGAARGDVCKLVMEDRLIETKDELKNTAEYTESACAICFFLPTKVLQKATPY